MARRYKVVKIDSLSYLELRECIERLEYLSERMSFLSFAIDQMIAEEEEHSDDIAGYVIYKKGDKR